MALAEEQSSVPGSKTHFKISRSFKQGLQPAEMSFCLPEAVLEIPGVDENKESKWSLLIHPTCCLSRLRHEPCPLEEAGGKSLLNIALTEGSPQAVSLAKIQLLGHPNRRLPVTRYIYDQKIYGVFLFSKMKAWKSLCADRAEETRPLTH